MSIVAQVQTLLNDTNVFWPNQNLFDAINEAQWHIYVETKWAISTATFSLTTNQDIITIPTAIQVPVWIEGTNNLTQPATVQRFKPTTQRWLESFMRTWRGNNEGQPRFFTIWDATHMRVFPRPDGSGGGAGGSYPMNMFGLGFPSEITTTGQDVSGPATYVQAIQNYSASILFEATRPDLADMYRSLAEDQILAFKKRLRNYQSHNIRQLVPATTRFEIEQGGSIQDTPQYYPLEGGVGPQPTS